MVCGAALLPAFTSAAWAQGAQPAPEPNVPRTELKTDEGPIQDPNVPDNLLARLPREPAAKAPVHRYDKDDYPTEIVKRPLTLPGEMAQVSLDMPFILHEGHPTLTQNPPRRVRHHPRLAGRPHLRLRPRAALLRAGARRLPGGQGLLRRRRVHHHPAGARRVALLRVPRRARRVRHVGRFRRAVQARDRRPLGDLRRQRPRAREAEGRRRRPDRPRVQLRAARAPRARLPLGRRPRPGEPRRRLPAAPQPGALRNVRRRLAGLRHRPAALFALLRHELHRRQALGPRGARRVPPARPARRVVLGGGVRGGAESRTRFLASRLRPRPSWARRLLVQPRDAPRGRRPGRDTRRAGSRRAAPRRARARCADRRRAAESLPRAARHPAAQRPVERQPRRRFPVHPHLRRGRRQRRRGLLPPQHDRHARHRPRLRRHRGAGPGFESST